MELPTTVDELFELFDLRGDEHYGEFVTQREHALQCAALAQRDGARPALVVAALFHAIPELMLISPLPLLWLPAPLAAPLANVCSVTLVPPFRLF